MRRFTALASRAAGVLSESTAASSSSSSAASVTVLVKNFASAVPAFGADTSKADTYNVPLGHHSTVLNSSSCNIGLNRRRDITLRQYLKLSDGTKEHTCAELFRKQNVIIVGVPGGSICTKTMIPDYAKNFADLKKRGVNKVVVVTQETPAEFSKWAKEAGVDGQNVMVVSDAKGYFTQMLGVEIVKGAVKNHRYSGYVEDGLLLKLNVEAAPAEYKVSSVPSMIEFIDTVVHKGNFKG